MGKGLKNGYAQVSNGSRMPVSLAAVFPVSCTSLGSWLAGSDSTPGNPAVNWRKEMNELGSKIGLACKHKGDSFSHIGK